jgi:signal transduction histidine kinase
MEKLSLTFFPYPHLLNGERREGQIFSAPSQCHRCDRQCERSTSSEVKLCSYGVNYVRLDRDVLAFGFLVPPRSFSCTQKGNRLYPTNIVAANDVQRAIATYRRIRSNFDKELELQKSAVIEEYKAKKGYEKDFLELLRPEIQTSFSYLHDYKQFITRVRQNINVVLESRYPDLPLDQKLSKALPSEKAIYHSAIVMEEKLQAAYLLLNPDRMLSQNGAVFRLHGLVIKYVRIYQSSFDEKGVRLRVVGESRSDVQGNSIAASVIPHTLIDNALKYSLRGSEVLIEFAETADAVELRVSSYGPEIRQEERTKIFEIFFRSKAAMQQEEEGAGFGLYLAQFAAKHLGTRIEVWQDSTKVPEHGYRTTFSVRFRRAR